MLLTKEALISGRRSPWSAPLPTPTALSSCLASIPDVLRLESGWKALPCGCGGKGGESSFFFFFLSLLLSRISCEGNEDDKGHADARRATPPPSPSSPPFRFFAAP